MIHKVHSMLMVHVTTGVPFLFLFNIVALVQTGIDGKNWDTVRTMLHNKCVFNLKPGLKDAYVLESNQWILSSESLQVVNLRLKCLTYLDLVLYSVASDKTH